MTIRNKVVSSFVILASSTVIASSLIFPAVALAQSGTHIEQDKTNKPYAPNKIHKKNHKKKKLNNSGTSGTSGTLP